MLWCTLVRFMVWVSDFIFLCWKRDDFSPRSFFWLFSSCKKNYRKGPTKMPDISEIFYISRLELHRHMVEVANWALSVTVSIKKGAEVPDTSCFSHSSSFLLRTSKRNVRRTSLWNSYEFRKTIIAPPPPASLMLLSQAQETTSPYHPRADPEIVVGGENPNFDWENTIFFFCAIGSNELNRERKLLWIILFFLLGPFLIILYAE